MRSESSPRVPRGRAAARTGRRCRSSRCPTCGRPEVIALEAPDFAQDLPPFGARVHRRADPIEVDPSAGARRRVRLRRRVRWSGLRLAGIAQAACPRHDQRHLSAREREPSTLSRRAPRSLRVEVEYLETARGSLCPRRARARRSAPSRSPCCRPRRDLPELVLRHRERRGAMPGTVRRLPPRMRGLGGCGQSGISPFERRIERHGDPPITRSATVRTRGARERQLELHGVVHRVERADRRKQRYLPWGRTRARSRGTRAASRASPSCPPRSTA